MTDSFRRRIHDAASAPSQPIDLEKVAARAAHLDRRTRTGRITAASLVVIALTSTGIALAARTPHATRVATAPPSPSTTAARMPAGMGLGEAACPGTQTVTAHTSPDGLPAAASRTDDRLHVQNVLAADDARIRSAYANIVSLDIEPGGGYVWDRAADGSVVVRQVSNYDIYVHLISGADCPTGARLNASYDGVGLTFVAPRAPTPTTTTTTTVFQPASIPAKPGDVDGDGIPDNVTVTWNATSATLVADLSRLGRQTIAVPVNSLLLSPQSPEHPVVLAVVDFDNSGYGEVFVQIDHGASTAFFTIFKLIRGRLTQMTENGQVVSLPLGGSVGHESVYGCGTGRLIEASITLNNNIQGYDGERDVYSVEGTQLVLTGKTTHFFATNGQYPTPAQLAAAGYLQTCPPLD